MEQFAPTDLNLSDLTSYPSSFLRAINISNLKILTKFVQILKDNLPNLPNLDKFTTHLCKLFPKKKKEKKQKDVNYQFTSTFG